MEEFKILILGSDANAYYMARCAYEEYQIKAHLIGKDRLAFTKFSNILTISYEENLWEEEVFVSKINEYARKYKDQKILVISTNETYSIYLSRNKEKLESNCVFFLQEEEILLRLTNKELFYKTYKRSILEFPETYYFDVQKSSLLPSISYPMIVKPANVVEYNHLSFEGKKKIYKIKSEEELKMVIEKIKKSGYKDRLILQEYINGDDSYLFDSVVYVDQNRKVKVMSFAQIGLQEHSKSMVGNAATLINGINTFDGDTKKMKENLKVFFEALGMNGFFEVDMKYDKNTNTFKVLEINARQGRCSYYLTPLGANLVRIMVDDLIKKKELPMLDLQEKVLLSFVPKKIVKKYIKNKEFKSIALSMWKKRVSPMECKKDKNIKRFLMMKKRLWHYKKEYKEGDWEE